MSLEIFTAYFESVTGLHLPDDLMGVIFAYYEDARQRHHWTRYRFCKAYLNNTGGIAQDIQIQANVAHQVERVRAAETIAALQRQLAEARGLASGAA